MTHRQCLAVGLLQRDNAVLLVQEAYSQHLWTLPSGYVEPGESFAEAAIREVQEETGLESSVQCIIAVRDRPDQLVIAFGLQQRGGRLLDSVPGEIKAVRWFTRDTLEQEQTQVNDFARWLAQRTLEADWPILSFAPWEGRNGHTSALFAG